VDLRQSDCVDNSMNFMAFEPMMAAIDNRQITGEIYQVGGSAMTAPQDAAIYLISFDGAAALIDSGCGYGHDQLLRNVRSCGIDPNAIDYLFLTHCHIDHAGGAKRLKDELGCLVVAHELDAHFIEQGDDTVTAAAWYGTAMPPVSVDRKIGSPEEIVRLGGRVIKAVHVPGHSPGSLVYVIESEGLTIVFAQDVHGPLHPDLLSDFHDYQQSLHHLLSLEADILCEGHFGVYRGKETVRRFIMSYVEK